MARPPARMCVECEELTTEPVVISEVHAGSGPGFTVYACPECAPGLPRPPDPFDLLEAGWGRRVVGEGPG